MTLEFNKVVEQVVRMGAMLEKLDFDLEDKLQKALERFQQAGDLDAIRERIDWVRQPDVSGYRGAAPLDVSDAEPVNAIYPPPELPPRATIVAADGSQIYPDEQAPVHYYLINIGVFTYHHGLDRTPDWTTYPDLAFHRDHVHDRYGRIVTNRVVDDRRTLAEIRTLGEAAWHWRRQSDEPIIALYDNRLMVLPGGDTHEGDRLMRDYRAALVHLRDANALLAGYIDNPYRGRRVVQLLYLLTLNSEAEVKQHQNELAKAGDLEGLRDRQVFGALLRPGERSAVMVQNSPQNFVFKQWGVNYEIAFFYLKVANSYQSQVVRVDVPVWVARDRQQLDALHGLILAQCQMQGRTPYPYALTRADELAVVSNGDKERLTRLINAQIRRANGQDADWLVQMLTPKAQGKHLARSSQRYHEMWGRPLDDE